MKKLSRKLLVSILSMAFAVVALGTTTFAWFTANSTATANLTVNVQGGTDGVLLSTDGKTYKPNVDITVAEGFELKPAYYDYTKTTAQTSVNDFKKLDNKTLGKAGNSFADAGILSFNLYVLSSSSVGADDANPKGIYFAQAGNSITTKSNKVTPYTVLSDFTYDDGTGTEGNVSTSKLNASTVINVSAANALRAAVDVYPTHVARETVVTKVKGGAKVDDLADFGATATKSGKFYAFEDANTDFASASSKPDATQTDGKYYNFGQSLSLTNAANSYLEVASDKPFGEGDSKVAAPTAPASWTNGFGSDSGLIFENGSSANMVTKLTFTFWLEGFDADCFDAILGQSMDIKLAFTTKR